MKKMLTFGLILTSAMTQSCLFNSSSKPKNQEDEYNSVYRMLKKYYLYQEEIRSYETYQGSIPQLMTDIKDPYTTYYNPDSAEAMRNFFEEPKVEGLIGFQLRYKAKVADSIPDTLEVHRIMPKSPAEKAQLKRGDLILKVNGTDVTGAQTAKYFELAAGGVGTKVNVEFKRGDSVWAMDLQKAEVAVPSVWVDTLSQDVSSILVNIFWDKTLDDTVGTLQEFKRALQKTSSDRMTLLDLRGNPGGSVVQCVSIANEFLAQGQNIIQILDRTQSTEPQPILADGKGQAQSRKFIVLADQGSASCSEILLSAILDHRSDIPFVGDTTYGKGIGQSFHDTPLKGMLKVTSLQFLNTTNVVYHKTGLIPQDKYQSADPKKQDSIAYALAQLTSPRMARSLGEGFNGLPSLPWMEQRANPEQAGGAWIWRK